jgi:hypothetical protein
MHESADRQFVWIIVFIKYLAGDMTEVPSIKMSGGSGESGQNACDDGAGMVHARKNIGFRIEGRRAKEDRRPF